MAETKEAQQSKKLVDMCTPILKGAINELVAELKQDNVILRHEVATLQTMVQYLTDMVSKEPIDKVVKGKAAAVAPAATEPTGEKVPKTANAFLHFALQNEEEFKLKSKFPIINDLEAKMAIANSLSVDQFRAKNDYKKLSADVWKNGNIQADVKTVFKAWNEKKNVVVQSASLEEDK